MLSVAIPYAHFGAVVGADLRVQELSEAGVEHIYGLKVSRGPNTPLGIIREVWQGEGIEIVGAGRISGRGHGDAGEIGPIGILREQPSVGCSVPLCARVRLGDVARS